MILRILLLACAIISPSYGKMDFQTFIDKFQNDCIMEDQINGQEKPLSQTMENFIALAEKFEAANENRIGLKEEIAYFLSEYLFENIYFLKTGISWWRPNTVTMKEIDKLWNPEGNKPDQPNDPYSQDEKCSLYYMISHSILGESIGRSMGYAPGNFSSRLNTGYFGDFEEGYYPQEIGVVAIRGTDAAVSLSKVLIGMYVGLLNNRHIPFPKGDKDLPLPDKSVDALYATTLVDVLVLSNWSSSDRQGLLPNGAWKATDISNGKSIKDFCPMVYKQQGVEKGQPLPIHSYSSLRGAADGLILGVAVPKVLSKKSNTKLSQILRMYYSREGIHLESSDSPDTEVELKLEDVTFCNRGQLVSFADEKLPDQMLLYAYMIAQNYGDVVKSVNDAKILYSNKKDEVFNYIHSEIKEYCGKSFNTERPEDLPRETFLDIIVVMDTSSQERYFYDQQMIVGSLAKKLDLRYTGSRMTILLDRRDTSEGTVSSAIKLKSVVSDSYSSSCAACMAGQIELDESLPLERAEVIVAIDQFLQERKNNETQYSGINGKVVVYFNYDNDEKNANNKIQGRLATALRNLHINHQDVSFYAVGLYQLVLEKYVKNDPKLIFVSNNGTKETVVDGLLKKITFAPALLQYSDCKDAKDERSKTYENFVSPHKIQHYVMPAEYFYKSRDISIKFESRNGYINVCHNRVTLSPEYQAKSCKNTTGTAPIEFPISNPCINSNKVSCSPFYFSIMGMDKSPDTMRTEGRKNYCEDTREHWCSNLNQIKYTVSHTGIRCSGCLRLNASIAVIFLTVLLTYFVQKRF